MKRMMRRRRMKRLVKGCDFPWMPAGVAGDQLIDEAISLVESVGSRLDLQRAAADDLEGAIHLATPERRWEALGDELAMRYAQSNEDGDAIRSNVATVLAEVDDDQHTLAMAARNGLGDDPPRTAIPWIRLIIKVLRVIFDMLDDAMQGPERTHVTDSDVIDAEFTVNEPPIFSSEMREAPGTTFTMEEDEEPQTNNQAWGGDTMEPDEVNPPAPESVVEPEPEA